MSAAPLLEVSQLSCGYGARQVLKELSFALTRGERVAVLGRSGVGKTTLLRAIAGLHPPSAGTIRLGGREVTQAAQQLVPPEERRVGLVFQQLALWPHMSVERALLFAGRGDREQAQRLAKQVGLGARLAALPRELSGGECQRLALARALAGKPQLLLLDEPFAHLDPPLKERLGRQLLQLISQEQLPLLLVTHQADDVYALAQRVLVLEEGRVVEEGPLEQLVRAPTSRSTVELLGLGNLVPGTHREGQLETPLGSLPLEGEASDGPAWVLIRPEQLVLNPDPQPGQAQGIVQSVRHTRPVGGELQTLVSLIVNDLELSALTPQALTSGATVALEVRGPCRVVSP